MRLERTMHIVNHDSCYLVFGFLLAAFLDFFLSFCFLDLIYAYAYAYNSADSPAYTRSTVFLPYRSTVTHLLLLIAPSLTDEEPPARCIP